MIYRTYEYHSSKRITTPRKSKANIKGMELEIGNENDTCEVNEKLDELIEDNFIKCPENEDIDNDLPYTIAIENDSSVFKELVLKASCNSTLLQGVKMLERELSNIVDNNHGTSCHIHLNNEYLKTLGLNSNDITKTAEFIAPILFSISGRDINSLHWCSSILTNCDIEDFNLYARAQNIDNLEHIRDQRYAIVNKGGNFAKTTELRIFSNYYNFNYNYIKLYLDMADFIIEIANKMKDKKYEEEYENLIKDIEKFFTKRNRKRFYENHNIKRFLIPKKDIKTQTLREQLRVFNERINYFNEREFSTNIERYMSFIRLCRNYATMYALPDNLIFDLNDTEQNILDITETVLNNIEEELNEYE